MDELIRRRDAIELIENIPTTMSVCVSQDECHGMKLAQAIIRKGIEDIPAIRKGIKEMPSSHEEIVRCGECKHRASGIPLCVGRRPDWYCAYGERLSNHE